MQEQAQTIAFEPSFSAASDQGRMVDSVATRFTKKPRVIHKSGGVTIYYRKNMRVNRTFEGHHWE